jgi:hypothetical protein
MATVLQRRDVPESISELTPLAYDYVDLFTADGVAGGSPEQWARAGVDQAAGSAGQFVWRIVLGLRLGPRNSPALMAGWAIADRGEEWIRLEASSWHLTAHLVVVVEDRQLSVATFIRYDHPMAKLIWPRLAAVHRRAMPGLLRRALRSQA